MLHTFCMCCISFSFFVVNYSTISLTFESSVIVFCSFGFHFVRQLTVFLA